MGCGPLPTNEDSPRGIYASQDITVYLTKIDTVHEHSKEGSETKYHVLFEYGQPEESRGRFFVIPKDRKSSWDFDGDREGVLKNIEDELREHKKSNHLDKINVTLKYAETLREIRTRTRPSQDISESIQAMLESRLNE